MALSRQRNVLWVDLADFLSTRKLVLSMLALAFNASVYAQQSVVPASELTNAPEIDGRVLEDPIWQGLEAATGFTQVRPFEGRTASQRTEVYVGYDTETLYVAVVCFDDDPEALILADSRRDASLEKIDSFQMVIDPFLDRQNGYVFGTTPMAAEYDGQVVREGVGNRSNGAGGFTLNWDASWQVESVIGDFGWSAEFAIPFRSLRFSGRGKQNWGINFQRNIGRTDEVVYWSPLNRQHNIFRVSEAGTLTDVSVPTQRGLKITPYLLTQLSRGGDSRSGTREESELGIDAKFSLTPSLTLDMTYNTDFAQVEADEVQVNLGRFSIFLPEKRPFFLENAGQFSVGAPGELELFFSRRIGLDAEGMPQPIDRGMRLSGKVGRSTNLGILHMQTGESGSGLAGDAFSVVRLNQEFASRSSMGLLVVDKRGDLSEDNNQTYALDGRWGIGDEVTVSGFIAQTDTPNLSGDDMALRFRAGYSGQAWDNFISYSKVGDNFNPEVGFLRRKNYQRISAMLFNRRRIEDTLGLFEMRPHVYFSGYENDDGFYETGFLHVDNHWEWRNGFEIHTGVNFTREGILEPFEINDGVFVPPGEYDHKESQLVVITDKRKPLTLRVHSKIGGFYGGRRSSFETDISYRYGEAFTSNLSWSSNDIDLPVVNGRFKVNVARLRMSYSFSPKILLQALVQYDDRDDALGLNLRFSWLQTANSGLYLVYNELDNETFVGPIERRRQVGIKYSRIFDAI